MNKRISEINSYLNRSIDDTNKLIDSLERRMERIEEENKEIRRELSEIKGDIREMKIRTEKIESDVVDTKTCFTKLLIHLKINGGRNKNKNGNRLKPLKLFLNIKQQ